MKENRTTIRELVKRREELYGKLKEKLIPRLVELIKEGEKIKGYMEYWGLYHKLGFGLTISDYERIIAELEVQGLIKKRWSAGIGGFLTTQ